MTATRVMIVLLVLVAVLFAVTIAVARRPEAGRAPTVDEWIERVKARTGDLGRMELDEVVCNFRSNAVITFPPGPRDLSGQIVAHKGKAVRRLGWHVQGNGSIDLKFEPNPGDDRAMTSTLHLDAKHTNTLVVMEPGGRFTLTRPNPLLKVVVELH